MSDVMSFRGSFGVENSQPVSIYNLAAEGDEVTLLEILTSDNFDKNQLEILTEVCCMIMYVTWQVSM